MTGKPELLYKYAGPEAIRWLLEEQTLSFSALDDLNDPFEGGLELGPYVKEQRLKMDQYQQRARTKFFGSESLSDATSKELDRYSEEFHTFLGLVGWQAATAKFRCFGILSLTPNPHHLLMWSHYAQGYRGLVIWP